MTGDLEAMALYAGQGAGRVAAVVPAGSRLRAIAAEAQEYVASRRETPALEAPT